jgi:CreA protein
LGDSFDPSPGNCTPGFEVEDLDAARAALEAAGVAFDGDTQTHDGMVKLATFYDLDRNAVMLSQDLRG